MPRHTTRFLPAFVLVAASTVHAHPLDHLRTRDDIGENKVPHMGISHVLVIPSRVGSTFPAGELAALQAFFAHDGGPGTFRDYWKTNSNGLYDPIPTVVDPVIYMDRCPIPGKTLQNCTFSFSDAALLFNMGLKTAFEDVLSRVRDEQGVDLTEFDVNTAEGPGQDGWFDGIVMDSDMYQGIGFPLAAFNNTATVQARTNGGPEISCGIVAMAPPYNHEYGHILGFIDLYGGPTVNDLMEDIQSSLAAFSRQQLGWGTVVPVTGPTTVDLRPTLSGGDILRVGEPPRYLLLENRGGPRHNAFEGAAAGIWVHSIDESTLPTTALGFINVLQGSLYLPNSDAPYLSVAMPVDCNPGTPGVRGDCALTQEAEHRVLEHADGTAMGFTIRRGGTQQDGTITLYITEGTEPAPWPPPGGTSSSSSSSGGGASSSSSGAASSSSGGDPGDDDPGDAVGCGGCTQSTAMLPAGVLALLLARRRRQPR